MLFNSLDFAIFLPLTFLLYWFGFRGNLRVQNGFLLVASYVFYGWWDWRFLSLIAFSSTIDYLVGKSLGRTSDKDRRMGLLVISLLVNLGLLGFFKYYNFFLENFIEAFTFFGHTFSADRLDILLPVGISFYTFQTLSYTIDVYRGKLEPTHDPVAFFAYVSFFPQLVAGPIERAANLLPQFFRPRHFSYPAAVDGMRQILWGLFKKIVIADNAAPHVNYIFANYEDLSGSTLLLGGVLFAFQIYGDFSGYSDIAIGTGRLFGFQLMRNFAFPYFSRDIAEFWRRWHISLSTWFRDYLYLPLGGSRVGTLMTVRNVFIIFLVSGFWHGANWTFIVWGFLNALYFLPLMLAGRNRRFLDVPASGRLFPSLAEVSNILITFFLTVLAWIFFRAESVTHALAYLSGVYSTSLFSPPEVWPLSLFGLLALLLLVEWVQRDKEHGLELLELNLRRPYRWGIYFVITVIIFIFSGSQQEFIYFQF